ncbi:MAG: protein kinase domain-containing protein [Dokdonella sp.]|uniref:protein kinase domain-containing protein n=1 Tax=Dokdonella sp. TaxID=2291710 RepID=UPI003F7EE326
MTSPGRTFEAGGGVANATVTGLIAAADFAPGQLVGGRFRIVRLLGMGGMGVVYLARDDELDVDVALKLLRPEFASRPDAFERFRQELLLARQVSSPHVVRIHDLVRHGELWLISMDHVAGRSLEKLLDEEGALAPAVALRITRQVALGLAAAHHRHVVHRDLKPANVLINEKGDAAITDFGVARSAGSTGITGSGVIIGTPEYLSPEQARAETIDGRSDLYALGLILFEMLTGTLPFRGGTPAEMLAQRIVRDPPSVSTLRPGLPPYVVRLCAKLLELRPARRFQSADEVVRAIDHRRVPGLGRAPRRLIAAGVAALLLGATSMAIVRWNARSSPTSIAPPAAAPLDLAVLPLAVDSSEAKDRALAVGVGRHLADALASVPGRHDADYERVRRALVELRFDADAASRHVARVTEALGARRVLTGHFRRDAAGITVSLAVRDAASEPPLFSRDVHAADDTELPTRLGEAQTALLAYLGAVSKPTAWPATSTLVELGRLQEETPTPDTFDATLHTLADADDTSLWWSLLQRLDRDGRVADANTVARRIIDRGSADESIAARGLRAYALIVTGDPEGAVKTLDALHAAAPGDPVVARLLARAKAELGDYDEALKLLEPVVAGDTRDIDAWYALGKYAIQAGDAKRAVDEYLVRAQVLANRLDDRRMRADVSNALGIGYRRLGQLTLAAEQLVHAEQLRSDLGDRRGQAATLRNLATVQSIQGDFSGARAALDKAASIIQPLGDSTAMADLANDSGLLFEERGEYHEALDAYRRALNLRQSGGDSRLVGESQVNVGFIYYQIGEFDNAQAYSEQAIATYAKVDDRVGAVHAQQNLGMIEVARGDWKAARAAQQASLRTAEELQMAEEGTISHAALAELDQLEGDANAALSHAARARAEFEKRGDVRGVTEMKLLEAATLIGLGDAAGATEALDGLDATKIENGEQASLLSTRRGEIALAGGDATAALADADAAIARARATHSLPAELGARLLRARALSKLGRSAEASRQLAQARAGTARYASVPLRLRLAETELELGGGTDAARWREARALLARLPAYGRAFAIHAFAARRLGGATADEARREARAAYARVLANTPAASRGALATRARILDIEPESAP